MKLNQLSAVVALGLTSITQTSIAVETTEPVIVTATRTAQTADETLASVTVITRNDIERMQANTLTEMLQSINGIDVKSNGGVGKTTSVFMRGTNSSHVLVMINGMRIGSVTAGTTSFQDIPLSQIERIEIVRGPRAALYGSDAIGGVINIFTHKTGDPPSVNLSAGYGSYQTSKLSAGTSGKLENIEYAFQFGHFNTDGHNVITGNNPDKDSYENNSISTSLRYAFNNKSALEFGFLHAKGENQYDNEFDPSPTNIYTNNSVQQSLHLKLSHSVNNYWNTIFSLGNTEDKYKGFTNGSVSSATNSERQIFTWQNDFYISKNNLLTAGFDYLEDKVKSTTNYNETSRDNHSVFIQNQWDSANHDFLVALRRDDNEAFGSHTTGNVSWGYTFNKKIRLITSYGTAFMAPTFNNLYYPGGGNPNLKPEESETYEVSLRGKYNGINWDVTAYNTQIDNLISGWPGTNVNKSKIDGIEISASGEVFGWQQKIQIGLIDPINKETNKVLQSRSKRSMRWDLDRKFGKWSFGSSILAEGYRYNDAANTNKLGGFGLVNLRLKYALSKQWSIHSKIDNLLDKKYETVDNYNNAERSLSLSINYKL